MGRGDSMNDESRDLLVSLAVITDTIVSAQEDHRSRIAEAYKDAQSMVVDIALDERGSHRPRILACFGKFDALKRAKDPAATGWMLTAMQERISEGDLPEWRAIARIVAYAVSLLGTQPKLT